MSRTLIKICGITRVEDGLAALEAGANWLGFIRWNGSKRYRPIEACAETLSEIRRQAANSFDAVAVYVDATSKNIEEEVGVAGFDRIQLHGQESPEFAGSMPRPAIKTIKVSGAESVIEADRYPEIDILSDTDVPGLPGGTGRGYDASILADLIRRRRVIVAGGLNQNNVGTIVQNLRPYGVDVSSGVEVSPGVKDAQRIHAFVSAVRNAEQQGQ